MYGCKRFIARRRAMTAPAGIGAGADLAAVVATEARLDRELGEARATATALLAAARARAEEAAAALADQRAATRARIDAEIAAETEAHVAAVTATGLAEAARHDAICGARLVALGAWLAERVVALVLEDAP
jgi:hypothetical protein